MGTHVSVELDSYAYEAFREHRIASEQIREATARRDKARDALITFLRMNEADGATVDGTLVVTLVEFDRTTVDAPRLKDEEPFVYRRFARVAHVEQLRTVDGTT